MRNRTTADSAALPGTIIQSGDSDMATLLSLGYP
jgi:hypothetical protein